MTVWHRQTTHVVGGLSGHYDLHSETMRAKVRLSPMNRIGGRYYEPKHSPITLTLLSARKRRQVPFVPEKKRPPGRFFGTDFLLDLRGVTCMGGHTMPR